MDTDADGIHASTKYEDLIRQQMTGKMMDEVERTEKNGRRTPIGDLSIEPFFDGGQMPKTSESLHGSLGQALQMEGLHSPMMEFQDQIQDNAISDFFDNGPNEIRSTDGRGDTMADVFGSEGRRTPLYTAGLSSELVSDVLEKRQSPSHEIVGDVIETGLGHSASTQSDYSSLLGTGRPASQHSNQSSVRSTPQRDLISDSFLSSQERSYPRDQRRLSGSDRNSSHGGSDHYSLENLDDRPQSLTSEQELTQYFDQGDRRTPEQKFEIERDPVVGSTYQPITAQSLRSTERPSSTTSLPVITTRQRLQAEKRSMTPDNHIRVPITASPLLRGGRDSYSHARPSSASSRASSRTITPAANIVLENGYGEVS